MEARPIVELEKNMTDAEKLLRRANELAAVIQKFNDTFVACRDCSNMLMDGTCSVSLIPDPFDEKAEPQRMRCPPNPFHCGMFMPTPEAQCKYCAKGGKGLQCDSGNYQVPSLGCDQFKGAHLNIDIAKRKN